MSPSNKPDRDLTYRVGWRRGRIGQSGSEGKDADLSASPGGAFLFGFVWREARFLRTAHLGWMLWTLALVSFICSLALVYALGLAPE